MSTTTHNHILPLPKAVFGLKIAQLVVAIVVLGLCAYGVTYIAFDGDSLMLFTAIATMIITVYYIVAVTAVPTAYNYWAILSLDAFAIIFWIISMSILAWEVAAYSWAYDNYSTCIYYYCYKKRDVIAKRDTSLYTYRNALAAAAGLGGLEFILFVITLVITSIHLHRHRKAGGHCTTGALNTAPAGAAPVTQERKDLELQGGPAPHPAPQYAPQPQYTQPPQQQHVQPAQQPAQAPIEQPVYYPPPTA